MIANQPISNYSYLITQALSCSLKTPKICPGVAFISYLRLFFLRLLSFKLIIYDPIVLFAVDVLVSLDIGSRKVC
jgi:hypothetical protein